MKTRLAILAMACATLFTACAHRIEPGASVYLYVAPNGSITLWGEQYHHIDEVPEQLKQCGATPETRINIIEQGEIPRQYLEGLAAELGNAGFPNCTIRMRRKATTSVQTRGTGVSAPPPAKVPKVVRGSHGPVTDGAKQQQTGKYR